ncbi:HNH endonuclease [Pseudalkalibacillus hwajinpoensis]|uniref:HNH endonuclease n=1 Tax=Guptibacillus hwajinpoensis TaxID=208199 RepID=A0A4U1MHH3_9BACL|nr:HNH endonuclease signature motif containing protein [Pseudalkalibacillus hwajinpoensis]TKD70749.1 HNH endonuclease [Pseudalkalibacillus hwajinpoensis]
MNPEETVGKLVDANRRYFAVVLGKYLEDKYIVDNSWRSKSGWNEVKKRHFNNECFYCGVQEGYQYTHPISKKNMRIILQKEHLDSIRMGGLDVKGNVVPACSLCNREKSDTNWEEYLNKKIKSQSIKDIKINKINCYRENFSNWSNLIEDTIYKNSKITLDIKLQQAIQSAHHWITNEIYQDKLYEYLYHITTIREWNNTQNSYSAEFEIDGKKGTPCSYEFQINNYIDRPLMTINMESEKIIILSFKKDEVEGQYEMINVEGDNFFLVKGVISLNKITSSEPFCISHFSDIKNALSSIKHSLTSQGVNFAGYEPK